MSPFRKPMALRAIRKYVAYSALMFFLFPIYGLTMILLFGERNSLMLFVFISPYALVWLYMGMKQWAIDCPRCRNPFFRRGIVFLTITSCSHCGLSIFDKDALSRY